jgi:DNA-binding NtrC family response regulator
MSDRRLLIVEDHDDTRRVLARFFRLMGYEVVAAATVAEAIEALDSIPDGVILDLRLPDGPGETVLKKIRDDALPTQVIVCTGLYDLGRLSSVRNVLEPHAFLLKPVDVDKLIRAHIAMAG